MNPAWRRCGPGLAAVALAAVVTGCAQTPTGPASSLPDKVIRNVPGSSTTAHEPAPLPLPTIEAPLHDELPPTTVQYADVLDRIRAGSRLPDIDHPWVRAELNWYVRNGDYMARVFARAQRYLHYIADEVEARGLPMELALLPVVESAFNPFAYSRSHASGLWQFIPGTGKLYELKQDWWRDERRDVLESTRAALEYLTDLHQQFDGDWMLAVAAYNYGRGNINRAIRRNESLGRGTDFFSLSLPRETRAYVPKLLALSQLVRNPDAYGVTLPAIPDAPYFEVVQTGGPVDLRLAAELAGVDAEELHALNAGWNQWVTGPDGPHRLLVPAVIAPAFNERFAALGPAERAGLKPHTLVAGETLSALASQHRVPVAFLQSVNGDAGTSLNAGDAVYVPGRDVSPLRSGLVRSATSVHVVRSGESLWSISRRHGMSVAELARVNGLSTKATLRPGQRLAVRPPASGGGVQVADTGTGETRQIAYKVRRGDTLSGIARRFAVSVRDLMAWNDMQGTGIRTGQRLTVHVNASRDYGG
ncbi:MAG: lytic transglycosylase, catalytic [Proteobacteria bacterium]|nr:lytic transglycosylase, catalytic [Pseudomonadota bacterium]